MTDTPNPTSGEAPVYTPASADETILDRPRPLRLVEPIDCCDDQWQAAYLRFESAEAETRKFERRLESLGAHRWPRDAAVVELFCGRGSGLAALTRLGFESLEGVDLSERLLSHHRGPARLYVCDCRRLPFDEASRDIVVIHGGLHHLTNLDDDLHAVLYEVHRVLRPGGRFVLVEPWLTPFLKIVHACCRSRWVRAVYRRLDDLATMIERERSTYEAWLGRPRDILSALTAYYTLEIVRIRWGKLAFVGRKQSPTQ